MGAVLVLDGVAEPLAVELLKSRLAFAPAHEAEMSALLLLLEDPSMDNIGSITPLNGS